MKNENENENTPNGGGFMAIVSLAVALYLLYLGFSTFA